MSQRAIVFFIVVLLQLFVGHLIVAADEVTLVENKESALAEIPVAPKLDRPASSRRQSPSTVSQIASVVEVSKATVPKNSSSDTVTNLALASKTTTEPTGSHRDAMEQKLRKVLTTLSWIGIVSLSVVFLAKLRNANAAPGTANRLKVLSTVKIAPRCCLSVVSANGQEFLIARDAGGVKNIVALQCNFEDYVASSTDELDFAAISADRRLP